MAFKGVARGCGWQLLAACTNLGCFYVIGLSISVLLGFKFNLHTKGLWTGLICGLSCQAGIPLLITLYGKWSRVDLSEETPNLETCHCQGDTIIFRMYPVQFYTNLFMILGELAGSCDIAHDVSKMIAKKWLVFLERRNALSSLLTMHHAKPLYV
ncbi:hypothetical protein QQP08_013380, partial [Theobroma cacao]